MKANTITELTDSIRMMAAPSSPKARMELAAIRSWAFSPIFSSCFSTVGPFEFLPGEDPPDFCVSCPSGRIAIEVTSFTTPQFEVFSRERDGPGLFTSTLRKGNADRDFWQKLRSGELPDDSMAIPHAEPISDLDTDYVSTAAEVLQAKVSDLVGYRAGYAKCILLVDDRLSTFRSDWERRTPILKRILGQLSSTAAFSEVILVDGNQYPTDTAWKL